MKKARNVAVSISLPLNTLVYLSKRISELDMSTSEYVQMLLADDEIRQKHIEDMIESAKNCTLEQVSAITSEPSEEQIRAQIKF